MPVQAKKYRPPFVTQRGIDSTLDDCAVVATEHGLADASSGEFVTNAYGQEKSGPGLQALARKMRRGIDNDDGGGLTIAERQEMCRDAGYPTPKSVDVAWPQVLGWLKDRKFSVSVSGNPSNIKGPSPLKRCDCGHEWFIWGECPKHPNHLIYYDGLRPWGKYGKNRRGECRPAKELRQMAFKDSDGELNYVLKYPVGGWTAEELFRDKVAKRLADFREEIKGYKEALKNPDRANQSCAPKVKLALDRERAEMIDIIEERRK